MAWPFLRRRSTPARHDGNWNSYATGRNGKVDALRSAIHTILPACHSTDPTTLLMMLGIHHFGAPARGLASLSCYSPASTGLLAKVVGLSGNDTMTTVEVMA